MAWLKPNPGVGGKDKMHAGLQWDQIEPVLLQNIQHREGAQTPQQAGSLSPGGLREQVTVASPHPPCRDHLPLHASQCAVVCSVAWCRFEFQT